VDFEIPVALAIDVEPDPREAEMDRPGDWLGFSETHAHLMKLRTDLARATGAAVHFAWYLRMDPQVEHVYGTASWVADRYPDLIQQIVDAGDELGLHVHAFRWDDGLGRWISDYGNESWVDHCVATSFRAFEKSFGRKAESFRFGDRFMSNRVMQLLEDAGVKYDLTQEPGKLPKEKLNEKELHTGMLPDYRPTPRRPFHPSRLDFRRQEPANGRPLWEVPLGTGANLYASGPDSDSCALNLASPSEMFRSVMEELLQQPSPYLSMVARTNSTIDPIFRKEWDKTIDYILSHPRLPSFRFVTPENLVQRLE
jgi:hypothetical protein